MGMTDDTIEWFSPDPRAVLPLDKFHMPHGLRRTVEKKIFETRINTRFGEVIRLEVQSDMPVHLRTLLLEELRDADFPLKSALSDADIENLAHYISDL